MTTEKIIKSLEKIQEQNQVMISLLERLADTFEDYTYQPEDEPDEDEIDISGRVELWKVH